VSAAIVMPNPSIPVGYVAGTLILPLNAPLSLLLLIQNQLEPDCPGSATELQLIAGAGSQLYFGAASRVGGPLSPTNYAYQLQPGFARLYRSTYPGNSVPLGELQVYAAGNSATYLYVEVQA
jgi:hypothetical protein